MHMTQENDRDAKKLSQRGPGLRRRKGWKGFVWGYKDWIKAAEEEGRWDAVSWGKNGDKSGAKSMERDDKHPNKIIYRY